MLQLPSRVDGEDPRDRDPHRPVGVGVVGTIAVPGEERILPLEERLNVLQTSDFELLGISVDDFSFESMNKRVRIKKERSLGQTDVSLLQRLEVVLGDGGLADGPGTEVHDLVAVVPDLGVELGHSRLGPVPAYHGQEVPEDIALGDGAVDVGYDDLVVVVPEVDVAPAPGGPLEGRGDTELHLVTPPPQVEFCQLL